MTFLTLKIDPPCAEIIINRPEKRNALSIEMWEQIPEYINQANAHEDVKVIILHGGLTGHFAAGADISEFPVRYGDPESALKSGTSIRNALSAVELSEKPVIAAIEGNCVGGGVSLSVAADLRFASRQSCFGITPAKLGLVYPPIDTRLLVRAVGTSAAKDLLFTGRLISAEEALSKSLIDEIVPDDMPPLEYAKSYAAQIASVSQWSVRAIKKMLAGLTDGWEDSSQEAQALFLEGFANADHLEGYRAFLSKRKPEFPIK